jgi:hypothetical protein
VSSGENGRTGKRKEKNLVFHSSPAESLFYSCYLQLHVSFPVLPVLLVPSPSSLSLFKKSEKRKKETDDDCCCFLHHLTRIPDVGAGMSLSALGTTMWDSCFSLEEEDDYRHEPGACSSFLRRDDSSPLSAKRLAPE